MMLEIYQTAWQRSPLIFHTFIFFKTSIIKKCLCPAVMTSFSTLTQFDYTSFISLLSVWILKPLLVLCNYIVFESFKGKNTFSNIHILRLSSSMSDTYPLCTGVGLRGKRCGVKIKELQGGILCSVIVQKHWHEDRRPLPLNQFSLFFLNYLPITQKPWTKYLTRHPA